MVEQLRLPTNKDYRFFLVIALMLLMFGLFGIVIWKGGSVELAIAAGVTPFAALIGIAIEGYFKSKEA